METRVLNHLERERAWIESLPGVHFVEAADSDYPGDGVGLEAIEKGEPYYRWSTPLSGVMRRKTCPRPSEVVGGALGGVLAAREYIQDAMGDPAKLHHALAEAIGAIASCAYPQSQEDEALFDLMGELDDIYRASGADGEDSGQPDIERRLDALGWEGWPLPVVVPPPPGPGHLPPPPLPPRA